MKLEWHGDEVTKRVESACLDRVTKACLLVEAEAKSEMDRKYPPASQPGEIPAVRTGTLKRSITHDPPEIIRSLITGRVGTNLDYGLPLEIGTDKMAPRPWLRVALDKVKNAILALFGL